MPSTNRFSFFGCATMVAALLLPQSARAADAGYCVNMCGNACYKNSAPSCEFACRQRCMYGGGQRSNSTPSGTWGSIFVARPGVAHFGWSYNAGSSSVAEATAARECAKENAGKCARLITYVDRCGVAVQALDGDKVLIAIGRARPRAADAIAEAMAECHTQFPKAQCKVAAQSCARGG